MDVHETLTALYAERRWTERAVARLEVRRQTIAPRNPHNRGRKSILSEERLEASRRMSGYWAARRRAGLRQHESR